MGIRHWSDAEGLAQGLADTHQEVKQARRDLVLGGPAAANLIVHAYSWAGRPDAEATAKGARFHKVLGEVGTRLQELELLYSNLRSQLREAILAAEEPDVRQKNVGPTLNV